MITEGYVDFEYAPVGKPMQTWYRVIGDLTAAKNPPLVCLHGGPGGTPHLSNSVPRSQLYI